MGALVFLVDNIFNWCYISHMNKFKKIAKRLARHYFATRYFVSLQNGSHNPTYTFYVWPWESFEEKMKAKSSRYIGTVIGITRL